MNMSWTRVTKKHIISCWVEIRALDSEIVRSSWATQDGLVYPAAGRLKLASKCHLFPVVLSVVDVVASRVTGGFADLWVDCWLQVGHCWLEIGASRSQEAALGRPAKVSHCSSSSIWIWICCRNLLISASKVQETALHWEATTPLSNFKLLHVFVDLCQHCISHWASGNRRVIGGH